MCNTKRNALLKSEFAIEITWSLLFVIKEEYEFWDLFIETSKTQDESLSHRRREIQPDIAKIIKDEISPRKYAENSHLD